MHFHALQISVPRKATLFSIVVPLACSFIPVKLSLNYRRWVRGYLFDMIRVHLFSLLSESLFIFFLFILPSFRSLYFPDYISHAFTFLSLLLLSLLAFHCQSNKMHFV